MRLAGRCRCWRPLPAGSATGTTTVLAALGRPFYSIEQGGRLWIEQESSPATDPVSFGGQGATSCTFDAFNVEHVPDHTSLLILRADPAGGGASLLGDLRAALAGLTESDRAELRRPLYFEGRADGLHGAGGARLPFPVAGIYSSPTSSASRPAGPRLATRRALRTRH